MISRYFQLLVNTNSSSRPTRVQSANSKHCPINNALQRAMDSRPQTASDLLQIGSNAQAVRRNWLPLKAKLVIEKFENACGHSKFTATVRQHSRSDSTKRGNRKQTTSVAIRNYKAQLWIQILLKGPQYVSGCKGDQ